MFRVLYVLGVFLLMFRPALAQTTANGSIRGVVTDAQGAVLAGATVTATSATQPFRHTAVADAEGRYRLGDVAPGDYEVAAELSGFSRFVRTPVTVRAGLNLDVDIEMTVGAIDEVVEVRVETPLLESRSAGHAVNVSGELLRALPLSERREWFGAVLLAPGVTTSETVNNERLFFVHGADSHTNIVQVDGADMTGAFTSPFRYLGLNLDSVDDVQIKTAGLDASAPLGLGGIVNIATTSGTNRVKGAATVFVQPRSWNASNTPGGTSSTVDQLQTDLAIGTPLVKDRLWGFGAYRYVDTSSGISRTPAQIETLQGLVPGFTPFDSLNQAHFWFFKGNAQLGARHQLSGFYQRDINPASTAAPTAEHAREDATGGTGTSVRLSSVWSNTFTTRFGASYNDKRRDGLNNQADEPLQAVYQGTLLSSGRLLGNGRLASLGSPVTGWSTNPNYKVTISADATWLLDGRTGSHEMQGGLYLQPRIEVRIQNLYPNGGFVLEDVVLRQPGAISAGVTPFHRVVLDGDSLTSLHRRAQDYAVYVQDAWRPHARLTLNAGVRIDRIVWTDVLFDVTTQRSTEVGPRFGVNYALTADGRNVARAHWVRLHAEPAQTGASMGVAALGQRDLYDLNLDGTFETTLVTPPTMTLTPNRTMDPDFHQPYVNEWGAGYQRQFAGGLAAGLDLVRRDYLDRGALEEINARYDGSVFTGYVDEAFNDVYRVTNNQWNWPAFTSLELSLSQRTSRVQSIASYVRQWRHIGGTWQPGDPASFIQPLAFANSRGIGSTSGATSSSADANSLSGTHMAQWANASGQWQDHVARLGIAYAAPWQLQLSTNYTFQSGAWSGPVVDRLAAPDPQFGPPTVTLSNGRVVSNPLATVIRFAHPTRTEGQLETPDLHAWNLRAGRAFSWRRMRVDASVDVFNVTNNGADASFDISSNQLYSPNFGLTMFRQLPRSAQLVLRVSY